jgi:hypothetical protein
LFVGAATMVPLMSHGLVVTWLRANWALVIMTRMNKSDIDDFFMVLPGVPCSAALARLPEQACDASLMVRHDTWALYPKFGRFGKTIMIFVFIFLRPTWLRYQMPELA